jgi:hypothetical protein
MTKLSYEKYKEDLAYIIQNTQTYAKYYKYLVPDLSDEFLNKKYKLYLKYERCKRCKIKIRIRLH